MSPSADPAGSSDRPPISSALDEETARADLYGLLATLLYAPPPLELLDRLRAAPTEAPASGAFLEEPWRRLVAAARETTPAAAAAEHDALFGGVGRPEVVMYGSFHVSGFLNDKPLARLRTDLAALGLARSDAMHETEDHLAYLFEVMRYLIAGDDVTVSNLTRQRDFFSAHLQPWAQGALEKLAAHPKAKFQAAVASFATAFIGVEAQGFDLMDGAA